MPSIAKKSAPSVERIELTVMVEKSFTTKLPTGDFVKVTVGVTLPFSPTPQTIHEAKKTLEVACELVDERLFDEVEKVTEG